MTKITQDEWLELVRQDADDFLVRAKEAEPDDLEILEREIETWQTEVKEAAELLKLSGQVQLSLETVEAAAAKIRRRKPPVKAWKGKEIAEPEPAPSPPEPPPPPPPPSSEPEPQKISKV